MAIHFARSLPVLAVFAVLPGVTAQDANKSADSLPFLRSFRITATGPKGEPVSDLRPEEIQVTDNGKRVPLAFSHLLRSSAGPAPALGPREVSNRGYDQLFSSTLLLLDLLNANIEERGAAWNETKQSLGSLETANNVYLFLLTPDVKIYPVHAWNPDDTAAPAAPQAAPWTARVGPLLDSALRTVEQIKSPDLTAAPGLTADPTYQALTLLGREYASLPGQKRIIWVTNGMPLTVSGPNGTLYADFGPELKSVAAEFTREGISLYTVHQLDRSAEGINTQETLQTIAPLTGGRWYENDALGQAFTQARNDARASYEAGFAAPANDADGKLHKLRFTTTRKNVRIVAPESFLADPPQQIAKSRLSMVATRPFDTPDIGLRAAISSKGSNVHLEIRVDPRDLALQRSGNVYTGEFSLAVAFFNAEGMEGASTPVINKLSFTQQQLDEAAKDGYLVMTDPSVPKGASRGRILVQDSSGVAGSLSFPIGSSEAPGK